MFFLTATKATGVIMGPISSVLGWIMNLLFNFTSMFGILNIGLCIILFTLVIRLLMFPLTISQQRSSKLMSYMNPELQAIQKKYKGKTDNDSMMKMNTETQAVYDKYGYSMTGGCVQLIIQLPILFALYRVIYNIPAYVNGVKDYFMQVVYALTGTTSAASLAEGAADKLVSFAEEAGVALTGVVNVGDLTGISGTELGNKMVDILYKLNPSQWISLADAFPGAAAVIDQCYPIIERMNSFLTINLTTTPWQGLTHPNIAWLIPILAGVTQYASTRLMTVSSGSSGSEMPGGDMMKSMNLIMPLFSVFFCFTFPAAIGLYWVATTVFTMLQQIIVNRYMDHVDMDEVIKKNIEKKNKKREKQGLPPQKITNTATASLKNIEEAEAKEKQSYQDKIEMARKQSADSSAYYNKNADPNSIAAKANMVAMYNEKHEKSGRSKSNKKK